MEDIIYNMKEELVMQRELEIERIKQYSDYTTMNALHINFKKICELDHLIRLLDQILKDQNKIKKASNENNSSFD